MPSVRLRASITGYRLVDDAAGQAEREHAIVAQLPDPAIWIPRPPGLLHPIADGHVREGDAQPDDSVVGQVTPWRFPIAFGDEELHGLEPLLPLGIVAIAHADEAVTILCEKLLGTLLARLEMEPYPQGGRVRRAPGWRGTCGAPGGRDR
jgi:hypothetical protein